ncbi:hypothetical protein TYRP_011979 [Tyrophagus putrescentiae]|nr:hypothetical protein TYRP_011979 [Tyrophagus putrescentiae]
MRPTPVPGYHQAIFNLKKFILVLFVASCISSQLSGLLDLDLYSSNTIPTVCNQYLVVKDVLPGTLTAYIAQNFSTIISIGCIIIECIALHGLLQENSSICSLYGATLFLGAIILASLASPKTQKSKRARFCFQVLNAVQLLFDDSLVLKHLLNYLLHLFGASLEIDLLFVDNQHAIVLVGTGEQRINHLQQTPVRRIVVRLISQQKHFSENVLVTGHLKGGFENGVEDTQLVFNGPNKVVVGGSVGGEFGGHIGHQIIASPHQGVQKVLHL